MANVTVDAPTSEQLAQMAIEGDIEELMELIAGGVDGAPEDEDDGERDRLVYKWLVVASDFGHPPADDYLVDWLEGSSLRFDDDNFATGHTHWELGLAYLAATEGLPRDLERGRAHLAEAKQRDYPMSAQGSVEVIAAARRSLAPDAAAVLDAIYGAAS